MLFGFLIYTALEAIFRIGVLRYLAGPRYIGWKLVSPHLLMFFSPGYWLAKNCKSNSPRKIGRFALRARLISNYNLWNFLLSLLIFVIVIAIQREGYSLLNVAIAVITWRFISRSIEITIAFGQDITTSVSKSKLSNPARMKLAINSYFEIFLFSSAYYSISSCNLEGLSQSSLGSLYVGTLTNVAFVADNLEIPHMVFFQIFSTLSLVLLSIAGYIGKVKSKQELPNASLKSTWSDSA